jgi:hypothetical protein
MSNEVTKKASNLPATYEEEADNLLAATDDVGFEKLLKFKKGRYHLKDGEVPLGSEYVAHPSQLTLCWIKFVDGKVAERRHGKAAEGYEALKREELDDNDPASWAVVDGTPKDPWAFQHLLPLENLENGEVLVFVTSSIGGEIGIKELVRQWAKRVKRCGSRALPIIKLSTIDMQTKKYGPVPRPSFPVTAWDEVPASGTVSSPPGGPSDEIPF